ncbi:MAG: alpha/beta hydrolase [Proteobacteria bacterium]|nr:alpha/beta hydrolase [Pseudomonadota bacterium]
MVDAARSRGHSSSPAERAAHVEVNGLRLLCREWGPASGFPIVLLHGLRGYSATWRRLATALGGRYRLVAIDQRGRGESDWDPGRNYYTDAYLADLEGLVDRLELRRFVLLGHSMGGTTAYVYAARHPKRVAALVIEDIAPGSSTEGEGAERIRAEMRSLPLSFGTREEAKAYWRARRPSLGDAALEERLAESMRQDANGRWVWRYDAEGISAVRLDPDPSRIVDLWPVVARIATPTLVIRGAESDFCPEAAVARMSATNPHIASATVPGASHYVHDDQPEVFNQLVARFIAAHVPEVP